jgi:type III restriction enzyme
VVQRTECEVCNLVELKFDSTQEHQISAIDGIVRLFDGQIKIESGVQYIHGAGFVTSPNRLDLADEDILKNLNDVQESRGLLVDKALEPIEETIDTVAGKKPARFLNFSVEMETGTGKTYVYIRTAIELSKRYGFKRFIIVVPSVAIKEGVLKTFQITQSHFEELYDNIPYRFYPYDSSNLAQVRQFCTSGNLEFMIMTLDSFNKSMTEERKGNVIRRPTDRLQGATPIHMIQVARPILILDEPQNMESEKSVAALAALNPVCALRYSATHRNPYNLVHRLSPADAYRQGLVKKIEVASVLKESDVNQVFIRLDSIAAKKNKISAALTVNKLLKTGMVKQSKVTVRPGDNLFYKTNLTEYSAFVVDEINPGSNIMIFSNGSELRVGESQGADKEAIFEAQIRYTVEEHFRKQKRLKNLGLKVLSLFFIDRVENYTSEQGVIRRLFAKAFNELKQKYEGWKNLEPADVEAAYFASTKKKGGEILYEDSVSGESQKDEEAYDLIMKDKERLLSFDTKESFIFSHSALREGWDNPNVFQICTLNQTASEIKKRQEIGRGVRLGVNQNGDRILDPQVNILTVVANQSYEQYVSQLQNEIITEYGDEVELPPRPANARKRVSINLRKEFLLKPEFKELWDKIKNKTKYSVKIDSEQLVDECARALEGVRIKAPRIVITKAQIDVNNEDAFEAIQLSAAKTYIDLAGRYPLPNLAEIMSHLLENTTPPIRLTKHTLIEIFLRTKNKKAAIDNPFEFASVVVGVLKEKVADILVNGIKYEKINEWYEMSQLQDSVESWEDYVVPSKRSIYDNVEYDSGIEKKFVEELERLDQVKMFIKLPAWFTITTPVGEYNPDWAIVWEERDVHGRPVRSPLLYLVRETKSTTQENKLRPDERRKIACGKKHFREALGVNYAVVASAKELPGTV